MRQFIGTALLLCLGVACQQPNDFHTDKYEPTDHLFLQRAAPDAIFDVVGWQAKILQLNREELQLRKSRTAGNWVTQGPGNAGARINTVAVSPLDPRIILIGYSAGGIYKTSNGGLSWKPVFDDFALLAIGDLVFDPAHPNVVYAGTGDPNISGIPFIGNGLYRSDDVGETWQEIGLKETGIISEIIVDSKNNILYAATMGIPYYRDENRGLYRSADGGSSWQKILYLGSGTGVIDVAIHPTNSQILYAAGWDRIRNYEESITTGTGARIHKSLDGGATWTMLEGGLPNMEHSRIGIELSLSNPNRLYAVYVDLNHELEHVYTSVDGGSSWAEIPTKDGSGMGSSPFGGFGWYFGKIRLNPTDENDLYLLGVRLWRWDFRIKRWSRVDQFTEDVVHADKHDLVFVSPDSLLLATDGGLYQSIDRANSWRDIENIPTTQFYRVAYNPHQPDFFYGGAQDNGSLKGNKSILTNWEQYFGGDGFRTIFHPDDSLTFYVETQNGGLSVTIDGGKTYEGATKGIDRSEFVNWDAPVIMSHHNPQVLYYGTDRIYRSTTGSQEDFKVLSGALTDAVVLLDATSNISVIAESPQDPKLLFAGTGDGNLYRTVDSGISWQKSGEDLPDRYITDFEFSTDSDSTVYISHSGFKLGENTSHLHRSTNLGDLWTDLSGNLPSIPINSILILPNNREQVLFAGTDAGVYFTVDGGRNWQRLGKNMPTIPVFDLIYNPEENLIVAGTYAKSIMTYDLNQEGLSGDLNTAIVNEQLPSFQVWPNPATDYLNFSPMMEKVDISITDIQGANYPVLVVAKRVKVSHLAPGIYLLTIRHQQGIAVARFIKS